jgi:hypothetical protein
MRRAQVLGAAGRFMVASFIRATDPRNAGKAHLYALNKIPGAESACGMKAGKISQIQEMFQLMEHSRIHELPQLSAFTGDHIKVT